MPYNSDLARQRLKEQAKGNLNGPALSGIKPETAVSAIREQRNGGPPASGAMFAPQVNDMAASRHDGPIPDPVAKFAQDPARAAAIGDDLDNLRKLHDGISEMERRINATPVVGSFFRPAMESVDAIQEAARQINKTAEGSPERQAALAQYDAAATSLLFSPLTGITNILAEPLSQLIAKTEIGRKPILGEERTEAEAQKNWQDFLNVAILFAVPLSRPRARGSARPSSKEPPVETTPPPVAPKGDAFDITPDGFVASPKGGATVFSTQKDAALWAVKEGKGTNQIWEIENNPSGSGYVIKQRGVRDPFSEPPGPGVDPVADQAHARRAQTAAQSLQEVEGALATTKTFSRDKKLAAEYVEQATSNTTIGVPGEALVELFNKHFANDPATRESFPFNPVAMNNAVRSGQPLEMPLSEYLEATAGQPWADMLRDKVIVNSGISVEYAKELTAAPKPQFEFKLGNFEDVEQTKRAFELKPTNEKILAEPSEFRTGAGGTVLPSGDLQLRSIGLPSAFRGQGLGTAMYEQLILEAAKNGGRLVSDTQITADAARVYKTLEAKGYQVTLNPNTTVTQDGTIVSEDGSPVVTVSPKEKTAEEQQLADIKDQGYDFGSEYWYSQTGKEFPEPMDIDPEGFTTAELMQFKKAKATTKAAAMRVVQEQFLGKLFKDHNAVKMSPTQYKLYSEQVEKAFEDLTERLWTRTLNKVKTQYTAEWKAAYNSHSTAVVNEVLDTPVMRLEHALRFNAKKESTELLKDNAFVDNGEPMTFYHASYSATIGTDKNPWKPVNFPVISFGTDPAFPQHFKGMSSNPEALGPESTPVVYIAHLKAKNPADFRNPEHVEKVLQWHVDQALADFKSESEATRRAILAYDYGLNPDAPDSMKLYEINVREKLRSKVAGGAWTEWELPHMWKDLGFDASYMKESPSSPHINAAVESGEQVFFKYVQRFEELNYRLDPALKAIYPAHLWENLPNTMFSKEKGLLPDDLAVEFGFQDGQQLLNELAKMEQDRAGRPFRKYVNDKISDIARQRALAEVGDLLAPDRIYQDASELFTAPEITEILTSEMKQLSDEVGMPLDVAQVELDSQMLFNQLTVKKALKIRQFERVMGDTGRRAEVALLKGKPLDAFEAKQKQLINHFQLIESHKLNKVWDRFQRNVTRWSRNKSLPNTSQDYLDRIHQLLGAQGVPLRRNLDELARGLEGTLEGFVERAKDAGLDIPYYDMPRNTLPDDMSVDDFNRLNEMLVALAKNGREVKKIIDGERARSVEEVVQEAFDTAGGLPDKPVDKNAGDWQPPMSKISRRGIQLDAEHRILESLFDYLDTGNTRGVHNRVLMDGATDAANTLDRLQRQFYSPLVDKFEKGIPKETKKLYKTIIPNDVLLDPRDGQPITLRRGDLLAVLANMGTKSNRFKLAEGYGTDEQAIMDLLNRYITKEEADFVQFVWDTFDEIFPLVDRNARDMKGFGLTKTKPLEVPLTVGTLKGGYYPVRYDEKFNTKPITTKYDDPENPTVKPFRTVSTPTGFEQDRTGYVGPIKLSLDRVLREHLRDVFVRVSYGKYLQSARRFVLNPKVKQLWLNKLGHQYYNLLMPWLEYQVFDVAMPMKDAVGGQAILRKLRQNLTLTVMGASYTVGRSQMLGLIPVVSELGFGQVVDGVKSFIYYAVRGTLNENVYRKSEEMRFRHWNLEQNVRDVHADIHALDITASARQRFYKKWGDATMQYINFMDKWTVSGASWIAAYKKARYGMRMNEADAIHFADKLVRKTQGTGRPKDLPAVQRPNNEAMRIFTFAYTWPGRYYNLQQEAIREFRMGNFKAGRRKVFWIFLMIPVITALVDGDRPEADEDPDEWFGWLLRKVTFGNAGTTIWTRDAAQYAERKLSDRYTRPPMTLQGRVIEAADRAISGTSKAWFYTWSTFLGLMGLLPGGGQIGKTGQFLLDVQTGAQNPENIADWYNGLTTGKTEKN